MDGKRGRDVGLAILAALAIALAAVAAAPMFAQGPGEQPGGTAPDDSDVSEPDGPADGGDNPILGLLAIIVGIIFGLWQLIVAALLFLVSFLPSLNSPGEANTSEDMGLRPEETPPADSTTAQNGSGGLGEGTTGGLLPSIDPIVVVVLVAAALLLLALLALRHDAVRAALGLAERSESSDPDVDLDAIGRIAGTAADQVAAADTPEATDNAIYRAWSEMVALLGAPDPQSGTPRQFADRAIEAGMDPDDVAALTRAFEEVRYGEASPSAERRELATDAFRRIETAYADEESEAAE